MITWDDATKGVSYGYADIPDEIRTQALEHRDRMIALLADLDDGIAEKYLEGTEIPEQEIIEAIRKATISLQIVPVMCGSALRNKGCSRFWTRWFTICRRRKRSPPSRA